MLAATSAPSSELVQFTIYAPQYYRGKCKTTSFDSFKLTSVTIETVPGGTIPEVPLPAGVILLLSGLTGLGLLKRFKSKAAA